MQTRVNIIYALARKYSVNVMQIVEFALYLRHANMKEIESLRPKQI